MPELAPVPSEVAAGARRRAYATMALAVAVGSFSVTFIKLVLCDISPLSLAAGRVVFSATAFVTIVMVQSYRWRRIEPGDRLRAVCCGLGGSAGFHVLYSWGLSRVSVAVALVVLAMMLAMVALDEVVVLSHRLGSRQFFGVFLSLLGVVVISARSSSGSVTVPLRAV